MFFLYIWGFTHLTLNNFWVRMKSYQNPRKKIKCQQETHVGMNFYKTLGLGQVTNHAIVWKFIQEFIVPYKNPKFHTFESFLNSSSSLLLLFLFLFFFFSPSPLYFYVFWSLKMRDQLLLSHFLLRPCLESHFFGLFSHFCYSAL